MLFGFRFKWNPIANGLQKIAIYHPSRDGIEWNIQKNLGYVQISQQIQVWEEHEHQDYRKLTL